MRRESCITNNGCIAQSSCHIHRIIQRQKIDRERQLIAQIDNRMSSTRMPHSSTGKPLGRPLSPPPAIENQASVKVALLTTDDQKLAARQSREVCPSGAIQLHDD